MSMNSGYSRWSRSRRAVEAERAGKRPLSRLLAALRPHFAGITRDDVLAVMEPCEWHHTSKYANATDYYDPDDVLNEFEEDCVARAMKLKKRIVARKLLGKLIRKHGHNGEIQLTLAGGRPWHRVRKNQVCYLGRVLYWLEHGACPDYCDGKVIEEERKLENAVYAAAGLSID